MSNILQKSDNLTILWDLYNYPMRDINSWSLIENKTAILLQIIITVNGKQKLFNTNYEIDLENGWIKDYSSWNDLLDFLNAIWYEVNFNIHDEINKIVQEEKENI